MTAKSQVLTLQWNINHCQNLHSHGRSVQARKSQILHRGSYVVRVAAVADESFASEVMSVTINAAAKDEPTEPTVNITYDDKNGNVNAIFTNITEEGMVYVAEYNENGTLLSIKSDEISDSVIIPFTCVNKSKVKVFIWKNDMKPLFNKVFTLN